MKRQEKFELRGQFFFRVEPIREVDSPHSAIRMNLNSQCLNIVGAVGSSGEIREIELDLIPAFVKPHGHGTYERFDSGRGLIIRSPEPSSNVFVVEDLDFEGEVFLKVLDNHD